MQLKATVSRHLTPARVAVVDTRTGAGWHGRAQAGAPVPRWRGRGGNQDGGPAHSYP